MKFQDFKILNSIPGGRTVAELTEVCMQLASKKAQDGDDSDSDASPINKIVGSEDEAEEPFIRHPFKVKDAPLKLIMNIKVCRSVFLRKIRYYACSLHLWSLGTCC